MDNNNDKFVISQEDTIEYNNKGENKLTMKWLEDNSVLIKNLITRNCKDCQQSNRVVFNEFREYLRINQDDYTGPPDPITIGKYVIDVLDYFIRAKSYYTLPISGERKGGK